ncbi:NADH dehydrogenase [ubiquinone] 1 beta subcomplex subunit 11, mitochondrial-like [Limulus polyphemus]|uniref:NADH dehydrogenase [ubiquinone] 1 beta subcomplex subunit 11, mitochondrial n=1 Tax=Limulus polyphemus TaxID=6850 RepID=A0ABM1BPR7_LIMPO|nr:NADH dehydrogenase [ubiquinone] 1 beta subcomplex subunit 11, mitochondrial-like [Limulus polyphemus]
MESGKVGVYLACRTFPILRTWSYKKSSCLSSSFISTSKKNKETAVIPEQIFKQKTAEDFANVKSELEKNWVSYGWSVESKEDDRSTYRTCCFMGITVCLVGGGFVLMYMPDFRSKQWSVREAFLQLHRREKLGLPLIDKNLIDPSKIDLPSDEELGDTEIII